MKEYLEIAKIINTHGIHGDMKLELWCDSPDTIKKIKTLYLDENGTKSLSVHDGRMHGKFLLLKADGIDNPEDAAKYKERILYAHRDDIPKKDGDFFVVDLIGTPVIDADNGTVYGILSDIIENPANDLYEVKTKKGPVYLPAVKQFLIKLDPPDGIYVRPIPGMFTEAVWNDGKSDTPDTGTPDTGTGDDT
ncbi:MAG: 16S rRNA processing protein RimM [Clostridia bacterium]|nr:16S rRNA processing protein RimM [Clostridia bacterium]